MIRLESVSDFGFIENCKPIQVGVVLFFLEDRRLLMINSESYWFNEVALANESCSYFVTISDQIKTMV